MLVWGLSFFSQSNYREVPTRAKPTQNLLHPHISNYYFSSWRIYYHLYLHKPLGPGLHRLALVGLEEHLQVTDVCGSLIKSRQNPSIPFRKQCSLFFEANQTSVLWRCLKFAKRKKSKGMSKESSLCSTLYMFQEVLNLFQAGCYSTWSVSVWQALCASTMLPTAVCELQQQCRYRHLTKSKTNSTKYYR